MQRLANRPAEPLMFDKTLVWMVGYVLDRQFVPQEALESIYYRSCTDHFAGAPYSGPWSLVHCDMGESRSPLVVAAYLMRSYNLNPEQALDRIVARNPHADPNHRFLAGLDKWAAKWRQSTGEVDPPSLFPENRNP